jgi:hypothetical protein
LKTNSAHYKKKGQKQLEIDSANTAQDRDEGRIKQQLSLVTEKVRKSMQLKGSRLETRIAKERRGIRGSAMGQQPGPDIT